MAITINLLPILPATVSRDEMVFGRAYIIEGFQNIYFRVGGGAMQMQPTGIVAYIPTSNMGNHLFREVNLSITITNI